MRHQRQWAAGCVEPVKVEELYGDLALLVVEGRTPEEKTGKTEGPHCPQSALPKDPAHARHVCALQTPLCAEATNIRKRTSYLYSACLPLAVHVFLVPKSCQVSDECLSSAIQLELWTIQIHFKRYTDSAQTLSPVLLLQAVRSFLHFSQLSAWLIKYCGKLPLLKVAYRIALPGEFDMESEVASAGVANFQLHTFPAVKVDRSNALVVQVRSRYRDPLPPSVPFCPICQPSSIHNLSSPSTSSSSQIVQSVDAMNDSCQSAENALLTCTEDNQPAEATSVTTPSASSLSVGSEKSSVESSVSILGTACSMATSRTNQLFEETELGLADRFRCLDMIDPFDVRFYISPDEATVDGGKKERMNAMKGRAVVGRRDSAREGREEAVCARRRRRSSRKILFSDQSDVLSVQDPQSDMLLDDLFDLSPKNSKNNNNNTGQLQEVDCSSTPVADTLPKQQSVNNSSTSTAECPGRPTSSKGIHIDQRKRFAGLNIFGQNALANSGIPLNCSPAPMKRNQHSFNYDASLITVAGLKNAFCNDHDSGSSDSEGGLVSCKSAPAATGLLGNFEESALNGRLKPFGSVDGFVLDLAASGNFHPAHISLPVTTFFFNVADNDAPSPYLGHCSLESVGRKGYHVPKKGTVQATLFNPQGTVVKMFVVRYDLMDMPVDCQTFVRQRTFFMPSQATAQDARNHRSWLRYLIHLRFATSRSGKLYLHSDIRMLFSRKSDLDAYNLEMDRQPADTFELRSFTEMPVSPKFSPTK